MVLVFNVIDGADCVFVTSDIARRSGPLSFGHVKLHLHFCLLTVTKESV